MLDAATYIKMVLKKKNITNAELCRRLNKIEEQIGDDKTHVQNITNFLNGTWPLRPKLLYKWEIALGLSEGTLTSMVKEPFSKCGKEKYKKYMEKLREIRYEKTRNISKN